MAPANRGYNGKRSVRSGTEFKSVLDRNERGQPDKLTASQAEGLAKLMVACLKQGAALYVAPERYGTVKLRIYDGDDKYEEHMELNLTTEELCEELIEAIWDLDTVGYARRALRPAAAELPAEARKPAKPTRGSSEGGVGPQNGAEGA